MAYNGFYGTKNGSAQTTYTDQPGVAIPGKLAFASDINLCDSFPVSDANGVAAGRGVKAAAITDLTNPQALNESILLPVGSETVANFLGVVVFDQTMGSDFTTGAPGWNVGRIANVLKFNRVGGRIWVYAREAVTAGSSTVNWITTPGTVTSGAVYLAGEFSPAVAAGGTAASTAITTAKWITSAIAGGVAMLEFPTT